MTTNGAASQRHQETATPRTTVPAPRASIRAARARVAERFQLSHAIRTISMGVMVSNRDEA